MLITLCFFFIVFSQGILAQRILLLEKPGTFQNYKYGIRTSISVKTIHKQLTINGMINHITDSTVVIGYVHKVFINDIEIIKRERYAVNLISVLSFIAGAGYFVLDGFNNAINKEYPIIDQGTIITSASLVGFSFVLYPFRNKKYRIGKPWRLQVMDMSIQYE